jgi:hypothetical protein
MNRSAAAAFIFATVSLVAVAPANAGPCAEDIAAFRRSLPQDQNGAFGTAPQSVSAQLRHQPTPETVARAKQSAQAEVTAVLARAEAFDSAGKQGECQDEFAKAKLLLNP